MTASILKVILNVSALAVVDFSPELRSAVLGTIRPGCGSSSAVDGQRGAPQPHTWTGSPQAGRASVGPAAPRVSLILSGDR